MKSLVGDLILKRFPLGNILVNVNDAVNDLPNTYGKPYHRNGDQVAVTMAAMGFALDGFTIEDAVAEIFALDHQFFRNNKGTHAKTDDIRCPVAEQFLEPLVAIDHIPFGVNNGDSLGRIGK